MRLHSDAMNSHGGVHEVSEPITNQFQAALDAAEMGAWDWEPVSGRVIWSPRTYELFGFAPGDVPTSPDRFYQHVHEDDRKAVMQWCEDAVRRGAKTVIEFRIVHAGSTVRWVRSTGRAITDVDGHTIHLVGVVDDVTHEKGREPQPAAREAGATSFSARQVARILGVAESTVKRMAAAGELECLRSSRKDSRRFAPDQVLAYLRRSAGSGAGFAAAANDRDMSGALLSFMEQFLGGTSFEELLDAQVRPAAIGENAAFATELLGRLPFIVPERQRTVAPALAVPLGQAANLDIEIARCVLRAHGHEVLTPAAGSGSTNLVDVADRIRARIVVLFPKDRTHVAQATSLAARIGGGRRATATCIWWTHPVTHAADVSRIGSARDLDAVLRRL